jgi:hypothetical protein
MAWAMLVVRTEAQWCALGYMPIPRAQSGIIRSLSFKIGEVTKIRLGGEVDDTERLKQRWYDIMSELDLPVYEKESGAWPALYVQKRNRTNVGWYHD